MSESTLDLARALVATLREHALTCATAESCTGGGVAAAITDVAGSSDVFDRGFVTYSNGAKVAMLGVDPALIAAQGAVSGAVALAMAEGALRHAGVDLAVAVTGIAGPGGAVPGKPVGTVWFGLAMRGRPARASLRQFAGDRAAVRAGSVRHALGLLAEAAGETGAGSQPSY